MTDRTWVGGSHGNSVYAGANWSPEGQPQPGDTLYLLQGTANMRGGDLSGDTITMGETNSGPSGTPPPATLTPVLNVSGGATVNVDAGGDFFNHTDNLSTINVRGNNNVNINSSTSTHGAGQSNFTVNILRGTMTGSVTLYYGKGTIDGAGKFHNVDSSLEAGSLTIKSDMIGTGSTSLTLMHLDLGGSVSAGQTFSVGDDSTLTIDCPGQFHGVVQATGTPGAPASEIDLTGIHANSYSMANDLLTLYAGHKVVDRLALDATAAQTSVGQGSSGIVIGLNGTPADATSLLPLHSMTC